MIPSSEMIIKTGSKIEKQEVNILVGWKRMREGEEEDAERFKDLLKWT